MRLSYYILLLYCLSTLLTIGCSAKGALDKDKILPIIGSENIFSSPIYSAFSEIEISDFFYTEIAEGLYCFYIENSDNKWNRFVKKSDVVMTTEEMHMLALQNLAKILATVGQFRVLNTTFGCTQLSTGRHHLDASLILYPMVWELITKELGDSVIFAVPHEDHNLFIGSNKDEDIKGLVDNFEVIKTEPGRKISEQLYIYHGGIIKKYEY